MGATWTDDALLIEFTTGERFRLPASAFIDASRMKHLRREEMRVERFVISLPQDEGEAIELPWDFIRYECDARYRREIDREQERSREHLCAALVAARKAARLTQESLATKAGLSRPTIARLEAGETPSLPTLEKLAKALGKTVGELLSGEDDTDVS